MGKGKILLIFGLLIMIGLFGFWKWASQPITDIPIAPPLGCYKKDVENIFGKPLFTETMPDRDSLPNFSLITRSIYNIHKGLCLTVIYSENRVLRTVIGADLGYEAQNTNVGVLEKITQIKDDVEVGVRVQNLMSEAIPKYKAAIDKLKEMGSVAFKQKYLLELAIIKNGRGEEFYWGNSVFVDKDLIVYQNQKLLDISLESLIEQNKSNNSLSIFMDKGLLFDHKLIEQIKQSQTKIYFAGYNPEFKGFESHSLYIASEVETSGVKKLPILNFQLNGYRYKFGDEELNIVNIERFFDRPEYQKGQFRVIVEVMAGSTFGEVFTFFNYVPKNMHVHVK